MEAEVTNKIQKKSSKKSSKIAIISIVLILLIGGALGYYYYKTNAATKGTVKQQTATVRRGDLSSVVTGSGPITSANIKDVTPVLVNDAKLTKVNFNQGDKVKAGDLLFELDNSDAVDNVQNVTNQLTQAQLSQSSTISDLSKLKIVAPFSGYATGVSVKDGDNLTSGATVLTLVDKSKFKVTVPFMASAKIQIGQASTLNLSTSGSYQVLKGTVSYVSDRTSLSTAGMALRNIEITVDNPGYTIEGLLAGAEINGIQSDDTGKFEYLTTQIIRSDVSGTIKKVYVKSDQYITQGTTILELESDNLVTSKAKGDLTLQGLQTQLDNAKQKLSNYEIFAPIDGTIVKQTVKVGDTVKSGQVLTTINDNSHMEFTIPVDELDIAKVQNGQKVNITVDALSDTTSKPLTGVVSDIAITGTSSNGVTTYPVTISIDNPDRLKGGMNANASIIVSSKSNALYVPLQAVQKLGGKSFVWLKGATTNMQGFRNGTNSSGSADRVRPSGSSQNGGNGQNSSQSGGNGQSSRQASGNGNSQNRQSSANGNSGSNSSQSGTKTSTANQQYYQGAGLVPVEVGMSTDSSIEIISGLKEGDAVVLPPVSASTSSTSNQQQQRGPGGPGMFMGR